MMNKILAVLLFLAILPLPYAYYEMLRVIVCLGVAFIVITEWKNIEDSAKAILIVIAILFNPFAPIYLSKVVWMVVDFIAGIYLLNLEMKTTK
jgi:hypothetical protein